MKYITWLKKNKDKRKQMVNLWNTQIRLAYQEAIAKQNKNELKFILKYANSNNIIYYLIDLLNYNESLSNFDFDELYENRKPYKVVIQNLKELPIPKIQNYFSHQNLRKQLSTKFYSYTILALVSRNESCTEIINNYSFKNIERSLQIDIIEWTLRYKTHEIDNLIYNKYIIQAIIEHIVETPKKKEILKYILKTTIGKKIINYKL